MVTQEILKELLDYDPLTGEFQWSKKRRGVKAGVNLGSDNGFGYKRITVLGCSYYAHRLAWMYVHGKWPEQIDHINGNRGDNRIENLRAATSQSNAVNKQKAQKNSKSGFLGVSWHKKAGKWQVHICNCKNRRYLGLFNSLEEASRVFEEAKKQDIKQHFGEQHEAK